MPALIDHLAEMTGFRDRERLDLSLAGALRDLLRPLSVTIYRSVGEPGDERWLAHARLGATDAMATADPPWVELDLLPRRDADSARLLAFEQQRIVPVTGDPHRTVFPLVNDGETEAVIDVESARALDAQQQMLVTSFLRVYGNFLGLLDYSERDTLTGLLNRKTFDMSFMNAARESMAASTPDLDGRRGAVAEGQHWLGLLDIDHFKRVNDNHGHLIGDEVLLLLGHLMRSTFRLHDRLYRFGGEEFVVLMRCTDAAGARAAFERLRRHVEGYAFPQVGRITVSIGLTQMRPGDTPSGAFERADKAVYHAKSSGRNQIHDHADLVSGGVLVDDARASDVELF